MKLNFAEVKKKFRKLNTVEEIAEYYRSLIKDEEKLTYKQQDALWRFFSDRRFEIESEGKYKAKWD